MSDSMSFNWEDISYGDAGAAQGAPTGGIYQPNVGAFNPPPFPTQAVNFGAGGQMTVTPQSQYDSQLKILLIGGGALVGLWLLLR